MSGSGLEAGSSGSSGRPPDGRRRRARRRRILLGLFLLLIAALAVLRRLPAPPLGEAAPLSRQVLAEDGSLLRLTLAADGQYRLWTPLADMPPSLVEAVLLKEDRHFRLHPGVNPVALLRAAWSTYGGASRQGASTLTMQLARRLYGLNTRNVPGKLRQIALALWLEARYGKDEILEAYLNLAPMGGNIEGAGAASLIYFGKPAARLSLPESLALAVLPQQPSQRGRFGPALETARQRLAADWRETYPDDPRNALLDAFAIDGARRADLPFLAPHLSDHLLATRTDPVLRTTLSPPLQSLLEDVLGQYVQSRRRDGVRNAVALLVDSRDQSVKALVGSADFFDAAIHGQVNGAQARRSPGSTLKPFLYGLAIDQGVIHPLSVLRDMPTAFGYFQPENFDGKYAGPLPAADALVRSRNVPAVWVGSQLGRPTLHDLLREAGVQKLRSEAHYGLALTLGGGEITPEELARLYLMLAGDGRVRPLRYLQGDAAEAGAQLLSPGAAFMVRDMLRGNPRPDGLPPDRRGPQWPVAWKTGTSWGFHDAWSAGIVGPYVLVVWVGNFDGRSNPAFVGGETAAPLFFRIADALPLVAPARVPADRPPPGVERVEVCSASGDLPDAWCPRKRRTWYMPGVSPIKVSSLHRPVPVSLATGEPVCGQGLHPPGTRLEVFEFWPSDMRRLFEVSSVPRRLPPASWQDCAHRPAADEMAAPRIQSPLQHLGYTLRAQDPESAISLQASAAGDASALYWFADQRFLGRTQPQRSLAWRPHRAGIYQLRVSDEHGRSATRQVDVSFVR